MERIVAWLFVLPVLGLSTGCDDAHVSFSSCTSFSNDTGTGSTDGSKPRGCRGTVVVIVHDAPADALQAFTLTIRRLELVSQGRVFVLFDGGRRENLLDFRDRGFLLARRDDVPEVEFDTIRVQLASPEAIPDLGGGPLRLAKDGEAEMLLDPPLSVDNSAARRLRIDIDVAQTLAALAAGGAQAPSLEPVVRVSTDDDADTSFAVAPTRGTVRSVERKHGRMLVEADEGGGIYWASIPAAGIVDPNGRTVSPASLAEGQHVVIEGEIQGDVILRPDLIVLAASSADR